MTDLNSEIRVEVERARSFERLRKERDFDLLIYTCLVLAALTFTATFAFFFRDSQDRNRVVDKAHERTN